MDKQERDINKSNWYFLSLGLIIFGLAVSKAGWEKLNLDQAKYDSTSAQITELVSRPHQGNFEKKMLPILKDTRNWSYGGVLLDELETIWGAVMVLGGIGSAASTALYRNKITV